MTTPPTPLIGPRWPATLADLWIPGVPRTKGSLTVVNSGARGRKAHVEDTPESVRWRMLMVDMLRKDQGRRGIVNQPYPGAVYVIATFYQRVEDLTRKVAESGDLDKLLRNLFDALSVNKDSRKGAGVIKDDMQITRLTAVKEIATGGGSPGLRVIVGIATSRHDLPH